MILLDTNALIWIEARRPRVRRLLSGGARLFVSPATLLELQFLQEAGRIRLRSGAIDGIVRDERWAVDEPPAAAWFLAAMETSWTRDPFDRLLVAHARLRGWRLATGDAAVLDQIGSRHSLEV